MTEPTTAAGRARYPVRIKVYGGSLSLLPPGTAWRVERITEHVAPADTIGEPMTEWTIIDLAPIEAEARQQDGSALREALRVLVEWAEGEGPIGEGEGCHWCLFSLDHADGCPVGEARAALAALPPAAPPDSIEADYQRFLHPTPAGPTDD